MLYADMLGLLNVQRTMRRFAGNPNAVPHSGNGAVARAVGGRRKELQWE